MRDFTKFEIAFLTFIINVFIGILGESFAIQFLALFYIDLKRDLI